MMNKITGGFGSSVQKKNSKFNSDFYSNKELIEYVNNQKQKLLYDITATRNGTTILLDNQQLNEVQSVVKSSKNNSYNSGILLLTAGNPIFIDNLVFFDDWRETIEKTNNLLDSINQNVLFIAGSVPVTITPSGMQIIAELKEALRLLKDKLN